MAELYAKPSLRDMYLRVPGKHCIAAILMLVTGLTAWAAEVEFFIDPRAKPAIERATTFLKSKYNEQQNGYRSLVAYTLIKAGNPVTSPEVVDAIAAIRRKLTSDGYKPVDSQHAIYEATTDIALLTDSVPGENRPIIESIQQFIVKNQRPGGFWTYPDTNDSDTSITQYAILGLWAAERTGIRTPIKVWSNAAKWCLATQMTDGGFAYHPGINIGPAGSGSYPNMTFAGTTVLFVSRIYMYGDKPYFGQEGKAKPKKFGLLDDVQAQGIQADWDRRRAEAGDVVPIASLDQGINRGLAWISSHWATTSPTHTKGYFFYSLERVGALTASNKIGSHDWFNECLPAAIAQQEQDGTWDDYNGKIAATALTTLFLTRTTGRIIEKMNISGGLQTGGRGLPDDLAKANVAKGKLQERKSKGALDDLLSELANQDASALEDAQTAIVEKVQIGNREELLGQLETLRRLVKHPSAEVRRTAVWALGRSGQLSDALLLIQALNDDDVDVLVEANASLRFLSRKLSGVGIAEGPYQDLPENADDAQKRAAVAAWKRDALKRWTAWFTRVRPFEQRNDLFELLNRTLPDETK